MGDELKKDDLKDVSGGYYRQPGGACGKYFCDFCHSPVNCGVYKDGKQFYSVSHDPSCPQNGSHASCETCSHAFGDTGCAIDWT